MGVKSICTVKRSPAAIRAAAACSFVRDGDGGTDVKRFRDACGSGTRAYSNVALTGDLEVIE